MWAGVDLTEREVSQLHVRWPLGPQLFYIVCLSWEKSLGALALLDLSGLVGRHNFCWWCPQYEWPMMIDGCRPNEASSDTKTLYLREVFPLKSVKM